MIMASPLSSGTRPVTHSSSSAHRSFILQLSANVPGSACNETVQDDADLTSNKPRLKSLWRALRSVRIRTLFYSTLVAVLASLSFGYGTGFSSPALSNLKSDKDHNYFNKPLYSDIFNALIAAGGLIGALLAGWLVDYSGRQFTMVMCSLPFSIGWLLILITRGITGPLFRPLIFTGRFFIGMGIGIASLSVPLYLTEISTRELRGLFGAMNQLALTIGTLLAQTLGIGLHYEWLCVTALAILVVYVPLSAMTLRESPRWLINKGDDMHSFKALTWLRGPFYDIKQERAEIKSQIDSEEKVTLLEQFRSLFSTCAVFHPLVLAMFLMFFQQFSGINAIIFNAELIFKDAGVSHAVVVTAISIGAVQVVATLVGVVLTDIVGRKILLVIGGVTMCASLAVLSAYDFLNNKPYCHPNATPPDPKCKDNLQPLAITAMMFYIVGFSIGWGALPWLLASELIPLRVKGAGVGIATCFNWICAGIVLLSFESYQHAVKPWGTFLSFSVICLLSVIFVLAFIPETKGKSLEEIEGYFNRRSR